ncbi:hypothetical protein O6H91_09G046200 [Diphasiastrum complanatum]|uniref:Uncharacterized protein n=1 Tax=Diphasiastrum complanatum TaxID=34168 RepID=A0ACC2CNY0_DIPCM|nr:hypothetical protein O6H91_09G046200 [Diphasiastrum complanatum]
MASAKGLLDLSWYYNAKGWLKKRRKAILWAAAATGAGVCVYCLASWYTVRVRQQAQEASRFAILDKDAEDRVELQLQCHFESIQQISDSTTLPSVLPQVKDRLFRLVELSDLTDRLLAGKDNPQGMSHQDKVQLWQRIKILSFTRAISAMTAVALLELFIRVQMNILGRHMYIHTARVLSTAGGRGLEGDLSLSCQHRFLEFAEFLPHYGLHLLIEDIKVSVEKIMKSISLKQPYDSYELKDLLAQILADFISQQVEWTKYVLPTYDILPDGMAVALTEADDAYSLNDRSTTTDDQADFGTLMAETRAVLSSMEFDTVLEAVLDVILNEAMSEYRAACAGSSTGGRVPLARLLPSVANLASSFLEHIDDNRFIIAVSTHPKVQSFCAMVYASTA